MKDRHKQILLEMMTKRLLGSMRIPRGSTRNLTTMLYSCRAEAVRRTNYILAAIGEKL